MQAETLDARVALYHEHIAPLLADRCPTGIQYPARSMKRFADVALLLTISSLWAGGLLLVKIDVAVFPPITLGAWRASIASVAIILFCLAAKQSLRPAFRRSGAMFTLGLVGIVTTWTLVPAGMRHIGSGLATLMAALLPTAALIVIALPPIRAHVRWQGWVGVVVGALGLMLAIGPANVLRGDDTLTGAGIAAIGFAMFGVYCVLVEHLAKGLAPAATAAMTILYAAIMMWVLAFILESPTSVEADFVDWLVMFGIAIPSTAIPNLLVFVLVRRAGGIFMSFNGYTMPVFGIIFAFIAFGTVPPWTLYVGIPLVFTGMALVQWAQRRAREAPTSGSSSNAAVEDRSRDSTSTTVRPKVD